MFSGDTSYYDELEVKGKTIICQKEGQSKVKLPTSNVKWFIGPWKFKAIKDPTKFETVWVDTTRKCIATKEGKVYGLLMENDSVYFVQQEDYFNGFVTDIRYYIFRKKDNSEIAEMLPNDTCTKTLKKYFGGNCPTFDEQVVQLGRQLTVENTTHGQNGTSVSRTVFRHDLIGTLVQVYNADCVK